MSPRAGLQTVGQARRPAGALTVPRASSTTHEHLLGCVATEAARMGRAKISVLDAGCGDGQLVGYLQGNVAAATGGVEASVFGFDVSDEEIQRAGFLEAARGRLRERHADIDWTDRLRVVTKDEPWPFETGSFDLVVSNQVGEHIASLDVFFGENARVLRDGGVGVHLFPLRDYIIEGHLLLPLVHRIASHDLRRDAIATLSRLGLGKFRRQGDDLDVWAERHADYLLHLTHYRTWPEVAAAAKAAGLRASYRYTQEFYFRRLARAVGREYPFLLRTSNRAVRDALWFRLVRLVSGVTVVVEKRQAYVKRGHDHRNP